MHDVAVAAVVALLNILPVVFDGLDTVLTLTSMFYLQCYAITNLACLALRLAATPNFRPTFASIFQCPLIIQITHYSGSPRVAIDLLD